MVSLPIDDCLRRQYRAKQVIGEGATSCVLLAEHRLTGMLVAVKVLKNEEKNLRYIYSEVGILEGLRHRNIIRVFQILVTPVHLHIIMEYAEGGDLRQRIKQIGRLQEEEAQRLFRQIVDAMHYCHQRGIAHRDLKTHNILLSGEGTAKVSDFGLATECNPDRGLQRRCGTYSFSPPEIFGTGPYDGMKVDVWSMGVVLYNIITGHCPFKGKNVIQLKEQICQGTYELPTFVSKDVQDLIGQLLTANAGQRPTLGDIMEHPWLNQGEELPAGEPSEMDMSHPDPSLLAVLSLMGYDLKKIRKSLQRREYDEYMGTYLLLEKQAEEERRHEVPEIPRYPIVTPCPTPEDHYSTPHPLKSAISLPSLMKPITLSTKYHKPKEEMPGRQTVCRSASMPDIALGCPDSETSTKSLANTRGAVADPRERRNKVSEKSPLLRELPPHVRPVRPPNRTSDGKLVRRIRACLSRLCCCLSGRNSQVKGIE